MAILKLKDKHGNIIPVPVVTGDNSNLANALTGSASGEKVVRIDDISPAPHRIKVSFEPTNLIEQNGFFATNSGESYVYNFNEADYDKKYVFNAKIKENANLSGITVCMGRQVLGDTLYQGVYNIIENGSISENPIEFQNEIVSDFSVAFIQIFITDETTGEIHTTLKLSDIFESVSLTADINGIKFQSYGKNLTPYDVEKWYKSGDGLYDVYVPPCEVYITLWRDKANGTFDLRKYKPDGTYEGSERFLATTGTKKSITVPYREGYTYKIKTSSQALDMIQAGTLNVWFQVEVGSPSEYEEYKEPVDGVVAIYPTTTLVADTDGASITATYNKDTNKVIQELKNAILNLGGTINV